MSEPAPPPFRFVFEPRGDYLYVRVSGKLTEREVMLAYQRGIVAALEAAFEGRIVVDGRDAERPLIQLRAEMWTWMSESSELTRIAILANEEKTTKRVKRTADLNRLRVRGFHAIDEAEAWLRQGG